MQQRTLSATRQYPAVISFTEGDTLDEEAREEVPRPPLPSVNRARGRIGLDYMNTISHGATNVTSSDVGMVFRGDITRIGGTYWNLSGYWRGRLTKSSAASQQTLQNLINRTYHLSMTYDNPMSRFVAGFGRLYLPWAPSLDTIDGGYVGARLSKGTTLGIFGGSTPDPSSWDYSPNRVIRWPVTKLGAYMPSTCHCRPSVASVIEWLQSSIATGAEVITRFIIE